MRGSYSARVPRSSLARVHRDFVHHIVEDEVDGQKERQDDRTAWRGLESRRIKHTTWAHESDAWDDVRCALRTPNLSLSHACACHWMWSTRKCDVCCSHLLILSTSSTSTAPASPKSLGSSENRADVLHLSNLHGVHRFSIRLQCCELGFAPDQIDLLLDDRILSLHGVLHDFGLFHLHCVDVVLVILITHAHNLFNGWLLDPVFGYNLRLVLACSRLAVWFSKLWWSTSAEYWIWRISTCLITWLIFARFIVDWIKLFSSIDFLMILSVFTSTAFTTCSTFEFAACCVVFENPGRSAPATLGMSVPLSVVSENVPPMEWCEQLPRSPFGLRTDSLWCVFASVTPCSLMALPFGPWRCHVKSAHIAPAVPRQKLWFLVNPRISFLLLWWSSVHGVDLCMELILCKVVESSCLPTHKIGPHTSSHDLPYHKTMKKYENFQSMVVSQFLQQKFLIQPWFSTVHNIFAYFTLSLIWVHPKFSWSRKDVGSPKSTSLLKYFPHRINISWEPIWCHPKRVIRTILFHGVRKNIPYWKPSPNRTSTGFSQIALPMTVLSKEDRTDFVKEWEAFRVPSLFSTAE